MLLGSSFTQLRCTVGAGNHFLTASLHGCSTAASGKFRMQVSKASAYRYPTVVSYKFYKTAVCCARNERLSLPGQAVPGKPRCTVKPSTTSAWVQVMLNPPGVDWRIVNYVHDGCITLSRCECNVARFKPRSFCSAGGDSALHAISISLLSGLPACGQVPIAPCPLILRRVPSVLEQRTAACH